ncbi:MAG: transketolase [bacterium]|nr:transketolase [bacterium]
MDLEKKAALVRKWCLISTTEAGSGHPTTCLSAADLTTVLFDKFFTYDLKNPQNPNNDRIIFSKGHGAPLLYTLFAMTGAFPLEELKTLRKFGSRLEGHPTPIFPYADIATGSLGQGLSIGAGIAIALRAQVQKSNIKNQSSPKTYVLLGDGEMAEGSIWEASNFSSYYKLDNLIAILDVNRLGQSQETMFGYKVGEYVKRFSAFGWKTISINGHSITEIKKALNLAVKNKTGKPFIIIAKTKKGKGVSFLEDKEGWHGKPLKKEELERALKELGETNGDLRFKLKLPYRVKNGAEVGHENFLGSQTETVNQLNKSIGRSAPKENFVSSSRLLNYKIGDEVATREVYGEVLAMLGNENPLIYALDAETKNSTFSEKFKTAHPDRFIECFIAEQNMMGVALGLSKTGKIPFASTFAAFLTRGFDQIRMAAISRANLKFVGSHAGVSIGEDGPSQMGLEDIAMFGAIPNTVIMHPCDAVSTAKLLPLLISHKGISYLRTLRPKTSVIYEMNEEFVIGGSKILRQSQNDILTVIACGITVPEALKAYEELKKENIFIRIVDCYSIKPIDKETLLKCVGETKNKTVITVEDHFEHGGLGDFVLSALSKSGAAVEKMTVEEISKSGTKDELLDFAGINAGHIIKKVKSFI